jgi:hypothetical protein
MIVYDFGCSRCALIGERVAPRTAAGSAALLTPNHPRLVRKA